jgi:hypothetical protein
VIAAVVMAGRASREPARAAARLGILALGLSACSGRIIGPTPDMFGAWSATPLAADARLAQQAQSSEVCRAGQPQGAAVQIVLQDHRTSSTAAFLVQGAGFSGSCLITLDGGAAGGGGRLVPPAPMVGALVVDEESTGGVGGATASLLGGRLGGTAVAVRVQLQNGITVQTSIGGGHWLAWWPGETAVLRVEALDPAGAIVGTLDDTTPTWEQK